MSSLYSNYVFSTLFLWIHRKCMWVIYLSLYFINFHVFTCEPRLASTSHGAGSCPHRAWSHTCSRVCKYFLSWGSIGWNKYLVIPVSLKVATLRNRHISLQLYSKSDWHCLHPVNCPGLPFQPGSPSYLWKCLWPGSVALCFHTSQGSSLNT